VSWQKLFWLGSGACAALSLVAHVSVAGWDNGVLPRANWLLAAFGAFSLSP
jgi:hypothetical protein